MNEQKVSRELVKKAIERFIFIDREDPRKQVTADDFLDFLKQEEEREWCKHFWWDKDSWVFKPTIESGHSFLFRIQKETNWKLCPICGAKRPEETE